MAALPGIGASMRTPEAASLSAISSAKFTTELTLTPGAGSSGDGRTAGNSDDAGANAEIFKCLF